MDQQYSELNRWGEKLQRSGDEPDETIREVKKNIRLHDGGIYRDETDFQKDTKIIAQAEELKLIVRHDLLGNPAYQKVRDAWARRLRQKRLRQDTEIRRSLMHRRRCGLAHFRIR
jgi:hypothetical protein